MKTTITVSLDGHLFYIEDDAFQLLQKYLDDIEKALRNFPERAETMVDIEGRVAELWKEKINNMNSPVQKLDVEAMIRVIGQPWQIGETLGAGPGDKRYDKEKTRFQNRRLYRDPDNRVLGGVCSGMGSYFNLDPVILRVLSWAWAWGY